MKKDPSKRDSFLGDELPSHAPQVCMVIGDPIAHSLSPLLHNTLYARYDLSERFVFTACRVSKDTLASSLLAAKTLGIRGISVTLPHKEAVISYLDEIDPLAKKIGAVNTILCYEGKLKGYSTDAYGVVAPLRARRALSAAKVLILGAGGAARAAAVALAAEGAHITITNRTIHSAELLAQLVGGSALALSSLQSLGSYDIVIQATSLGMAPEVNALICTPKDCSSRQIVFDLIYTPYETRFLKECAAQGAHTIHGIEMFVHQALLQFQLYTGITPSYEEMYKIVKDALRIE